MKFNFKHIITIFVISFFVACSSKEESPQEKLNQIFETHGGLAEWRSAKTLTFKKGEETHTTDLQTRRGVINHSKYSMGFDGNSTWLDQDSTYFKGNVDFYYNLYFYFYAMPFVLGDNGILLEDAKSISFQNKDYKGIKVSYEANVGSSPDDNYILYFDEETNKMAWLAYTVTFKSQAPSDRYSMIKYDKWNNVNGLLLPEEIIWYKTDSIGNPTEPRRKPLKFTDALLSKAQLADSFYEKPKE